MGVAIYSLTNELLVPGKKIRRDPAEGASDGAAAMRMSEKTEPTSSRGKEEDPAAIAERDAALLMSERTETELTLRHPTHSRASCSSGPAEKQPWTFGGSYWPSRK
jgi:hypothetical protein